MNNFQLYRTNHKLSGQLKWDIIIDSSNDGNLYVADFHLSPISSNISYIYKSDEYLVGNSHTDNVKAYYKINKGHFYNDALDSSFMHNWPMICKENEKLNAYSNIYDMGCRRTLHYNKYKKQFEYLCPLWLENLNDDLDLAFKISVLHVAQDNENVLSSRMLSISKSDDDYDFHNKFVEYFKNYIYETKISAGNDDVINISFKDNSAYITGLNAMTGQFETKSVKTLVNNLLSRERPLMESDNMITQIFSDNVMICPQLFNFNICFDLEDIVSVGIAKLLKSKEVKIVVETYIGDELLEKRDFYTEYDYINKDIRTFNDAYDIKRNALEYLQDYNCVELINKNKFCQSICHWSLNDNNDYIFNLYDGFAGLYIDETGNKFENTRQYGSTPDVNVEMYNPAKNNTGWINVEYVNYWNAFYNYIEKTDEYKLLGTYIDTSKKFINDLVYNNIPKDLNGKYIIGIVDNTNSKLVLQYIKAIFNNIYNTTQIYKSNEFELLAMEKDDLIFLITNKIECFTFKNILNILNDYVDKTASTPEFIKNVKTLMTSVTSPDMIVFENCVKYGAANSPTRHTKEISYFKDTRFYYIFRYSGKIKPTFVKEPSTLYYKDYISDSENNSKFKKTVYQRYGKTIYEPLYPSIRYCAIRKINDWDYDTQPQISVSEFKENINICKDIEYTWFNDNRCLVIEPNLKLTYTNTKDDGYEELDDIVMKCIADYYDIDDEEKIKYITSLYKYKNNWEYASETNIDDYIYTIELTLK